MSSHLRGLGLHIICIPLWIPLSLTMHPETQSSHRLCWPLAMHFIILYTFLKMILPGHLWCSDRGVPHEANGIESLNTFGSQQFARDPFGVGGFFLELKTPSCELCLVITNVLYKAAKLCGVDMYSWVQSKQNDEWDDSIVFGKTQCSIICHINTYNRAFLV